MEEAHTGRQPAPKPCSLPHQCLGLRPTFLHPTFLLLPDESTGGAAPAAGSLRVPHLPAGSIIVGLQQWPAPPLGLGRDARGGAGQRTDGGRELASWLPRLGRLQNSGTPPTTLRPYCMLDRPDRCALQQLRVVEVPFCTLGLLTGQYPEEEGLGCLAGREKLLCLVF